MKNSISLKIKGLIIRVAFIISLSSCGSDLPNFPLPNRDIYPPSGEAPSIPDSTNIIHYGEIDFTEYELLPNGSFPNVNGYFTSHYPPNVLLNDWVNNNYNEVDSGSTITLIYNFINLEVADSLLLSRQSLVTLKKNDYRLKWGQVNPNVYTPSTNINAEVSNVLNTNYGQIEPSNPYRVIEFNYSSEEPTIDVDQTITVYKETFDEIGDRNNYPDGYWKTWRDESHKPKDSILKALSGTATIFQPYTRGSVTGVFVRLFNLTGDTWFIPPSFDLTTGENPVLSFELGFGYYNGVKSFQFLISTDFDGNSDNILNANWKDHTNDLTLSGGGTYSNVVTSSGYANSSNMNSMLLDLSQYAAFENVYIAFRDNPGLDPIEPKGPFTVISNINVENIRDVASVPQSSIESKNELYKFSEDNWIKQKESDGYFILSEDDYDFVELPFMTEPEAIEVIPSVLAKQIKDAAENDLYTVIYKNSATTVYNNNFIFKDGKWKVDGFEVEKRKLSFKLNYPYNWKIIND